MQLKIFLAKLLYCYEWCKKQQVHEPERSYPDTLRHSPRLWKPEAWCLCNCLSKTAVSHQLSPIVRGCVVWDLCVGIILGKNETKKRRCRLRNKDERKSPDGSGLAHEASRGHILLGLITAAYSKVRGWVQHSWACAPDPISVLHPLAQQLV